MHHPTPLVVYKASAGSGKTFTLATEYIKLLVRNPQNYRAILAVTFTNKATEEMKMRILSQLYGIWQQLPDSDNYARKVEDETGLPANVVRERAGIALHLLLHNYNAFQVQTIDAFFQRVLRNLARELELTANLRVGLSGDQVKNMAIDLLIDNLRHNDPMLKWLLRYIMESLAEDKSWSNNDENRTSLIHEIKDFGKTIFRDYYKEHRQQLDYALSRKGFFDAYSQQLRQMRNEACERMKAVGQDYLDTLEQEGLSISNIKNGTRGVSGFFLKLCKEEFSPDIVNKTAIGALERPENWYAQANPHAQQIHTLADQILIPKLRNAMAEREQQWKRYQSAQLTLKHLNNLRLLGSIEQKVQDINDENHVFLLGDTQHLLHALIQDSDSPFIFEKIGSPLRHVMIDEFQDTSTVQWQNFKVLMRECMSHEGSENLIVGDVKQSIYRWRSGDWRLLNNIERQFPSGMMELRPLTTNYRSERNIITFNNVFFTIAARQGYEELSAQYDLGACQLRDAYADVAQTIPDHRKRKGLVEVRLLPAEDYQERTLQQLEQTIRTLLDQDISQNHMAILVRTNDDITVIANYFSQHLPEVSIVSDEAFRLDASVSVRIMVWAMHLLTHPDDAIAKACLIKTWHREVLGKEVADDGLLLRDIDADSLLPHDYIHGQEQLLALPLYELAERIYVLFGLKRFKDQSAYVCAFYDSLTQFALENATGIDAFLETWEDELHKKNIQSDELNGIRILTIHKSKGLEYDHLMVPFCDWQLERTNTIWCEPPEAPFNEMPVIPVDYGKKMLGTIYEYDYLNEHLQLTVDNLNLLYVAFTRACKNLFVIGKRRSANSRKEDTGANCRSTLIEKVLPEMTKASDDLSEACLEGFDDVQQDIVFTYGTLCVDEEDHRKTSENVFLQPSLPQTIEIETFSNKTEFRQSNKSLEFLHADDDGDQREEYIKTGSILHHVFSTIRTADDIERALQELQQEGIVYDELVTADKVASLLQKRLKDPRVREWFSDRWTLYNECSILFTDQEGRVCERRPDRVMGDGQRTLVVDFKFGRPRPEYHEQVREYMHLLQQMGHPNVEGYLWYVYANKIEKV